MQKCLRAYRLLYIYRDLQNIKMGSKIARGIIFSTMDCSCITSYAHAQCIVSMALMSISSTGDVFLPTTHRVMPVFPPVWTTAGLSPSMSLISNFAYTVN